MPRVPVTGTFTYVISCTPATGTQLFSLMLQPVGGSSASLQGRTALYLMISEFLGLLEYLIEEAAGANFITWIIGLIKEKFFFSSTLSINEPCRVGELTARVFFFFFPRTRLHLLQNEALDTLF